ncbi:MAG: pyrroloquinoline quinone-dependent dehydrogenase [Candidatus Solibacter usitatus]|nr:pyrroloquinoline quinone-dependent dehydrogenase [Candidatus Solibacter usitatus]
MRYSPLILVLTFPLFAQEGGWTHYGADAGGSRYAPLKQIDRGNIGNLKVAWTYHTGAMLPESELNKKYAFEATPILANGMLYLSTPFNHVIALDPASGVEKWKYDPGVKRDQEYSEVTSRGVAAWTDGKAAAGAACRSRIFIGTIDARLIALDAATGRPCANFGSAGQVDLTRDVGLRDRGDYQVTSPPTVVGDVVILGSSIGDNRAADVERGVVRAFDARTGALRWTWDPIPWSKQNTPRTGAANAWSVISADPARDLIFVPTGSASPDFYGGQRPGNNAHANSVAALRASTGELVWAFQVAHHDLWDYDVASQPSLFLFDGKIPAVAVTTKIGHLFLLNRETGKPLLPVEERPVPKSRVPGEEVSPTQPFPSNPPLVPQSLTADDAFGATFEDKKWCRDKIASLRNDGLFTPPSLEGTLAFPGNVGGVNWGSAAIDPERGILVANTDRLAFMIKLIPRDKLAEERDTARKNRVAGEFGRQTGTPYAVYREPLLSPSRLPCNQPPWGALVGVDLRTGKKLWEAPLGGTMGSLNLGGPMATGGGLIFTAAAMDTYLRAFETATGREVWKTELPASAQATPMSYSVGGKQFIVICAGGHGKLGTKQGDSVVAFTLP